MSDDRARVLALLRASVRGVSVSEVQRRAILGYAATLGRLAALRAEGLAFQVVGPSGAVRWAASASAEVSPCGRYRYRLARRWGPGPAVLWIMFNPSTADGLGDDATIRRCRGFSERWGFGALEVVNLFAWRATDPKEIAPVATGAPGRSWPTLIGPENDRAWREALDEEPGLVVAAWGAFPLARVVAKRHAQADGLLHGRELHAVRVTGAGDPGHPLYAPYAAPVAWSPR